MTEKSLSEKREELFKEHIDNPAGCDEHCVKDIKEKIKEQDVEAVKRLKEEIDILDSRVRIREPATTLKRRIDEIFGERLSGSAPEGTEGPKLTSVNTCGEESKGCGKEFEHDDNMLVECGMTWNGKQFFCDACAKSEGE